MRRLLAMALVLCASHFSAMAQDTIGTGLRPFIGAGYTWGGDTIQNWTYTPVGGGTSFEYEEDVSAGAGLDLRVGLSYRFGDSPFTLQASIAHHIDQTHGVSSRAYFRRMPGELVLQWHANEQWRIGLGARRAIRSTIRFEGSLTCDSAGVFGAGTVPCPLVRLEMKSSTGIILEGEYLVTPSWGLKARLVHESYRFKDAPEVKRYDGSHLGLMTNSYFN
jgi:hypothetical protein